MSKDKQVHLSHCYQGEYCNTCKYGNSDCPAKEIYKIKIWDSERIHCCSCGKNVSTPVPKNTIIRAWIECPECIEKNKRKE